VVRMARAMDELSAEQRTGAGDVPAPVPGEPAAADQHNGASVSLQHALGDISLRVWAELGRARMPLGKALSMPLGAVVDLDRAAEAPVDLYVNGLRFGQGHLVLTDDGEWAVCVDEVAGPLHTAASRHRLARRTLNGDLEEEAAGAADVEAESVEIDAEEAPEQDTRTDVEDAPEAVQEHAGEADKVPEAVDEALGGNAANEQSDPESEGAGT
jgi:flagellar motor switch/type III secretory pathway protein FliN